LKRQRVKKNSNREEEKKKEKRKEEVKYIYIPFFIFSLCLARKKKKRKKKRSRGKGGEGDENVASHLRPPSTYPRGGASGKKEKKKKTYLWVHLLTLPSVRCKSRRRGGGKKGASKGKKGRKKGRKDIGPSQISSNPRGLAFEEKGKGRKGEKGKKKRVWVAALPFISCASGEGGENLNGKKRKEKRERREHWFDRLISPREPLSPRKKNVGKERGGKILLIVCGRKGKKGKADGEKEEWSISLLINGVSFRSP